MTKRIGILTSGGDCGGLNAVIRAVTLRAASAYVWEVVGIRNGSMGLLRTPPDIERLDPARLDAAMMRLGGTIPGTTNKGDPFAFPLADDSALPQCVDLDGTPARTARGLGICLGDA